MRHGKKINHLSRKTAHRKAMLSNMACSLIENKRINTTVAKAKALRVFIEPLMTKAKTDSTHSRRTVFRQLQNKDAVSELFRDVAPKIADREGGYTRIIRTGYRLGDNAEMCMIEFVDFNELYATDKSVKSKKRSRRGGSKASETAVASETSEDVAVDEVEDTTADTASEEIVAEEVVEDTPEIEEKEETVAEAEVETATEEKEETPAAEEKSEEEPKAEGDDSEEEKKED